MHVLAIIEFEPKIIKFKKKQPVVRGLSAPFFEILIYIIVPSQTKTKLPVALVVVACFNHYQSRLI